MDRFVGFRVPSRVSLQRFSPRDVSLPSLGSRRARFPDVGGTMKTLRLPAACTRFLMVSVAGSTTPRVVRVRRGAPDACRGHASGLGRLVSRRPYAGLLRSWTRAGSLRLPGNPSHAFALLLDPGRAGKSSPLWRTCRCCPRSQQTEGLSGYMISRLTTRLQHLLPTLHEQCYHCPCKACFRLAGCAFTGRVSNPLDRVERFRLHPSSFPGLHLTQAGSTPSGWSIN